MPKPRTRASSSLLLAAGAALPLASATLPTLTFLVPLALAPLSQRAGAQTATVPNPGDALRPPANGVRAIEATTFALVRATIHISPEKTLYNATLIVRDGRIVSVTGSETDPNPPAASKPEAPTGAKSGESNTPDAKPADPSATEPTARSTPAADAKAPDATPPDSKAPETKASETPAPASKAPESKAGDKKPADPKPAPPLPAELAALPASRIIDCYGLHLYPGFIDPFVEVDAPAPGPESKGAHWSDKVTPQRRAIDGNGVDEGTAKQLRSQGFTAAAIAPKSGIFRGSAAVVSLAKPAGQAAAPKPLAYRADAYQAIALELAGGQGNERWTAYPDSQMGAIAMVRQVLFDADWQASRAALGQSINTPSALEPLFRSALPGVARTGPAALAPGAAGGPTLLLEADNELEVIRMAKLAREFDRPSMILGSGTEFRRLEAITQRLKGQASGAGTPGAAAEAAAATAVTPTPAPAPTAPAGASTAHSPGPAAGQAAGPRVGLIIPLNFPEKPKATTPGELDALELRDLLTWEQAPTNPRRLEEAGLKPLLTSSKLKDRSKFLTNLRTAARNGLAEPAALAMLTTRPATALGLSDELGTLEAGKRASITIADGPLLAKKTKLRGVYIDGQYHELMPPPNPVGVYEGVYSITFSGPMVGTPKGAAAPATTGATTSTLELVIDKDGGMTLRPVKGPGDAEPKADAGANKPAMAPEAQPEAKPASNPEPKAEAKPDEKLDAKPDGQAKPQAKPGAKPTTVKARIGTIDDGKVTLTFDHDVFGAPGAWVLSGIATIGPGTLTAVPSVADATAPMPAAAPATKPEAAPAAPPALPNVTLRGTGLTSSGEAIDWTATKVRGPEAPAKPEAAKTDASAPRPTDGKAGDGKGAEAKAGDPKPDASKADATKPDDAKPDATPAPAAAQGDPKSKPSDLPAEGQLPREASAIATPSKEPAKDAGKNPTKKNDVDAEDKPDAPADLPGLPFGAHARPKPSQPERIIFTGATIWTSGPMGTIENGVLIISDGLIAHIGRAETPYTTSGDFVTIDCRGKHITAGIIDCHSHTGISGGVNEAGQAVTAEVRIGDVTNPDTQNWYRQLAGGVTTVNSLHGSANPIGGQNQVNKIRWGCIDPDDMHLQGAIPGIKFALGENVKQSNSSDRNSWRYPQTRMGVETLIRDRFIAAKEYKAQWDEFRKASAGAGGTAGANATARPSGTGTTSIQLPRYDLELEALAEILSGQRLIHCHSYRQDEILALAKTAKEFGFKLGTYQHILEGYKVADIVRDSSLGASAFSDWWAYKVEVQDAIPQAGPIMHEAGVVVSYNSDSDEMARRLNVEAAKAVKYSMTPNGPTVTPAEALKFITINPAKQLKIDGRTGSLEQGKDADVVVWSSDPLSSFAIAERTYIDGKLMFSLELDKQLRQENASHRARLLGKLLAKKPEGKDAADGKDGKDADKTSGSAAPGATPPSGRRRPTLLSHMWDQSQAFIRNRNLDLLRRGIDPANQRQGECGCDQ